ncbi:MAG: Gfo/Idh/MocA family oxidoreductase [Armatimonadetes bacterium]|nr:Gfo/Idh/MocA family oxidoreductase [Armatimonadota bacterium]
MKTFRWGLIGYGDLAHRRVASALKQSGALAAVWGRNPTRAEKFAREHGIPNFCSSLDDLIAFDLDAVYVCTPTSSHAEYAIKAMESHKHVLVEKPMASSIEECHAMLQSAKKHNVQLGVAYYRRAYPKMLRVRELIAEGVLGIPVWANIAAHSWYAPSADDPKHWRVEKNQSGGAGALSDIGVHRLDLLDFWLGESQVTHSDFTHLIHKYEVEDGSSMTLRLNNGAPVHAYFSWNSKTWMDRFEMVGSEGKILIEPLDGPQLTVIRGREREEVTIPPPENAHLPLVEDFVASCRENRKPLCDGEAGLRTNILLAEAIRGAR